MDISRNVPPLEDYNTEKHLESVKKGEVELYENEYHLVEQMLALPKPFRELNELEQKMVLFYIDKDFIEPYSGKKTENNKFASFYASYDNQSVIKKIFKNEEKVTGYDKYGNELKEIYRVPDPEYRDLRMKLRTHASIIWNKSNLKEITKSMKEIIANDGYKDDEILENVIMADAISDKRDSFTMQNRRLAADIKGIKKPVGLQGINVFMVGGGKESNENIVDVTHNQVYDLIPKKKEKLQEVERIKDE